MPLTMFTGGWPAVEATTAALKALDDVIREKGWTGDDNPYAWELMSRVNEGADKRGYKHLDKRRMRSLIAPIICYPYTFPGMYPMVYQFGNDQLCPKCAQARYRSSGEHGRGWVHEEGRPIECDECGKEIESAYGCEEDEEETA